MAELSNDEQARDVRGRIVLHLAEMQKIHVMLANDMRLLKSLSNGDEIRLGYEMLEQYVAISDAFLENMRGRFEARMGLLRRGEPQQGSKPEWSPGHAMFWLEFSRLGSVLRRISHRAEI